MNILDGARLANRQRALATAGAVSATATAVGAAASVMSIAQAIERRNDIQVERTFKSTADLIRKIAIRASRKENAGYKAIEAAESEAMSALGTMAKRLVVRGLESVGSWFIRMVMTGIRGVIIPMFRLLATATGFVLRAIFTNPIALGVLAAGGLAFALYHRYKKNEPEPIKPMDNRIPRTSQDVAPPAPTSGGQQATSGASKAAAAFAPATMKQTTPDYTRDYLSAGEGAAPAMRKLESTSAENNRKVLIQAMDDAGITNRMERAAFLAQADHESRGFGSMVEIGSPGYFKKYEGSKILGNTQKGDGEKFKGRGHFQLTGRDNYTRFGKMLGVDLVNNPDLAADPELSAKIAIKYWNVKGLGAKARAGEFDEVTRGINGKMNGKADRDAKYAMYLGMADKAMEDGTKDVKSPEGITAAVSEEMQIPTYGRLSSTYGNRVDPVSGAFERKHKGIDIAAPRGTPVYAAHDGRAVVQMASKGGYGNLLDILGLKFNTRYAHLDSIDVKDGEKVQRGQVVAKVGNTGRSTGNHLHFEVRDKQDNDIDPAIVMKLPAKTIEKSMVVPSASQMAGAGKAPVMIQTKNGPVKLENT